MNDPNFQLFTPYSTTTPIQIQSIAQLPCGELQEFSLTKSAIRSAIRYSIKGLHSAVGFMANLSKKRHLIAEDIVNNTCNTEYLSENASVFFVIQRSYRKRGLGRQFFERAFRVCEKQWEEK